MARPRIGAHHQRHARLGAAPHVQRGVRGVRVRRAADAQHLRRTDHLQRDGVGGGVPLLAVDVVGRQALVLALEVVRDVVDAEARLATAFDEGGVRAGDPVRVCVRACVCVESGNCIAGWLVPSSLVTQ